MLPDGLKSIAASREQKLDRMEILQELKKKGIKNAQKPHRKCRDEPRREGD